ncbi:hypothetical protein CORC01_06119 [Colletotrichum orchidophilum]|uniref:Xylanolytic transcriptional activator regulatory domain-containing protein n=1 Tax=Colletotrichum orchidophilum TaxID=1209926 RepID=A0A1G4BBA9_9PEZI|nr:uncharacterized protein CORC01_06119 [Colletotrichum orchidophilum]OHE98668.1 hypothetical protein CORC01_06119 [Colletotrichum orchidophilum]
MTDRLLDRIEGLLQTQRAANDAALSVSPDARSQREERDGTEERSSLEPPETAPVAEVEPELSHRAVVRLSLFFTRVTLPVPVFCQEKFYSDYNAGCVPGFLLEAMFSLSARCSEEPEILVLADGSQELLAQQFAAKAGRELIKMTGKNSEASIAEVKATFLLAYHDFTHLPSRNAAENCLRAVRAAYMCGLHQLDNPNGSSKAHGCLSDIEREEGRCLWWSIFSLDTFSSLISQVPSSIEDTSIVTCLPSTIITNAAMNDVIQPSESFLEDTIEEIWGQGGNDESHGAKVQAILIYAVALSRDVLAVRRLCVENPRCKLESRLVQIRERWASLHRTLPAWFFATTRHPLDRTVEDHPIGLEGPTATTDDQNSLQSRWKTCIDYALKVADAYKVWTPAHFEKADPIMFPITRLAACLLIFELMNSDPGLAAEKLVVLDSADLIMNSLDLSSRPSRPWNIVGALLLCSTPDN